MARVLTLCLILLTAGSTVALAQPGPNAPPQVMHKLVIGTTGGSATRDVFFGLDSRATNDQKYDPVPGLDEKNAWPPAPFSLHAYFYDPASGFKSDRDFRFGNGNDRTVDFFLFFKKDDNDNSKTSLITISYNLPAYVTGKVVDLVTGSAVTGTMNGTGKLQVADNGFGAPKVNQLKITLSYKNIPDGTLPVELAAFDAVADGSQAVLNWETEGETNNAGFEVEHAAGDGAFETIGYVAGSGTTVDPVAYSFRTGNLAPGAHSFRLKQVDFDGAFEYSWEASVNVSLDVAYHLSEAYPNPFNPQTRFSLSVAREQHVSIQVYDLLGRPLHVLHEGLLTPENAHTFSFDASSLPSGKYFIRAVGESFVGTRQVTLLK